MTNPYFIKEPAAVSFSGGRSSAYMLYRIIEAHGGKLPDYVKCTFANTGKEMPQTLDFVRDCQEAWGVDITWLELGEYEQKGVWKSGSKEGTPIWKASTVIVDYETASRNGEPFERLCIKRNYLPNVMARFCTAELKVRRIRDYLNAFDVADWIQCIGIRADEPRRAVKIHGTVDAGHEMYLPMYLDGIKKEDIYDFWMAQDFDLQLPNNNGTTDWGNCDLCFLKGGKKKISLIREKPELADWWAKLEDRMSETTAGSAARFRNDQPSYREMQVIARDQPTLFDFMDDTTFPCFCNVD